MSLDFFFITINKILRNWSKNTEEFRRKPCKNHLTEGCNWNQMITWTMFYIHVIRYINY